jgi:hypothetical protein
MAKVNGKEVDLKRAIPLTIGDLKALQQDGVDLLSVRAGDVLPNNQVLKLVEYVIRKADPAVTQEDIDATPFKELLNWGNEIQAVMPGGEPDPSS